MNNKAQNRQVVGITRVSAITSDEAELLADYRAMDDGARIDFLCMSRALAAHSPRQRAALKLVQAAEAPHA
jgi:hypothetical protein